MAAASKRLRIAVLYGGRSSEHEVSVMSATNVMAALDPGKYDAVPVFVTREGRWFLGGAEGGVLKKPDAGTEVCLVPGGQGRMVAIPADGAPHEEDHSEEPDGEMNEDVNRDKAGLVDGRIEDQKVRVAGPRRT